jgi:hypothetical protein
MRKPGFIRDSTWKFDAIHSGLTEFADVAPFLCGRVCGGEESESDGERKF